MISSPNTSSKQILIATLWPARRSGGCAAAPDDKSASGICRISSTQPSNGLAGMNSPNGTRCCLRYVCPADVPMVTALLRSEEHTSELQSLMRNSYAVFCLKQKTTTINDTNN